LAGERFTQIVTKRYVNNRSSDVREARSERSAKSMKVDAKADELGIFRNDFIHFHSANQLWTKKPRARSDYCITHRLTGGGFAVDSSVLIIVDSHHTQLYPGQKTHILLVISSGSLG
jgi:hypothetical protein